MSQHHSRGAEFESRKFGSRKMKVVILLYLKEISQKVQSISCVVEMFQKEGHFQIILLCRTVSSTFPIREHRISQLNQRIWYHPSTESSKFSVDKRQVRNPKSTPCTILENLPKRVWKQLCSLSTQVCLCQ